MLGVAIERLSNGTFNTVIVESQTGTVTQLSPTWLKTLRGEVPGIVFEYNKRSGKDEKVKTLITRATGTKEVKGESLGVAMDRARKWLAASVLEQQKAKR